LACAKREIMAWPGYKPTPVHPLPNLAARAGIEAILYKDEAERFGLGSFKALGGAYAVFKLLRKSIQEQKNVTASSLDLMLGYIRGTTTTTGLEVQADLDEGFYKKGQKVAWAEIDRLNLESHEICPDWNYTIRPRRDPIDEVKTPPEP